MATLPLTYPDLVCDDDLDLFAQETTSDLQNLEQDVAHVLIETLGSNLDDPNRGVGLPFMLSANAGELTALNQTIESELLKDGRLDAVSAIVTQTGHEAYSVVITVSVGAAVLGLSYSYDAVGGLVSL